MTSFTTRPALAASVAAPPASPQTLLSAGQPSRTALLCGIARARHQLLEAGEIFSDPLALPILGPELAAQVREALEGDGLQGRARDAGSFGQAMRGALVVRSRIAEDTLRDAVAEGATQYVVLGAGLDTFALRHQWPRGLKRVFEVDHPATQEWKRGLASAAGLHMPAGASWVPVDFEHQDFMEQLQAQGLDATKPTVFAWLGVTMYLAPAAVQATLARIGAQAAPGSVLVFDFVRRPGRWEWGRRLALAALARRFRRMGEPWRCFLHDGELHQMLVQSGFEAPEFITPDEIRSTLLAHRPSTWRQRVLGGLLGGMVRVRVPPRAGG